jgi:hypothetical protein
MCLMYNLVLFFHYAFCHKANDLFSPSSVGVMAESKKWIENTIYNSPTNALVCNKTLIQMSHTKILKITPTSINLLLPTWCKYVLFRNIGNYIINSTCFGHHNVHHQEVFIVHAPSGVSLLTCCDVRNILRWWCNYLYYEIKHMCIKLSW